MERKSIKAVVIMALALFLNPTDAWGQKTTTNHDKNKFQQIRSMEDGTWNFDPGLYYITMHKSYSGGEWYGFARIRWKESKSDVKRVSTSRIAQIPLEIEAVNRINHQIDSIQPLVTEETIRSAERMVDIVYPQYKDDFNDLGESISEALAYCTLNGKHGVQEMCVSLATDYDEICSEIEYIHKQGPGYEIEPTKRQLAYEDARERLQKLAVSCSKLARYVSTQL